MSKKSVLKVSALAVAIAATAAPMTAAAEVSGSLAISSQYLWRGQQLTDSATVSGSLDYGMESGLYAGVWTSSESDDTEYDLYAGFGGETDSFSYDISYIDYNYTAGGTGSAGGASIASSGDFEEVHLGLGVGDFGLSVFLGVGEYDHGEDAVDNKDMYISLSYAIDKVGILLGSYDFDGSEDDKLASDCDGLCSANYTHLDLSYALTDAFTFTASKIVDQEELGDEEKYDDDVVFNVSYSFAL